MKTAKLLMLLTLAISTQAMSAVPVNSENIPGENLVQVQLESGWLSEKNATFLHEEHLLHQAIEVYKMTLPAMNFIGMRDGSHAKFGKGSQVLPIWKDRMDETTLVATPNADVIYSMGYLDLKKDGPTVVAAPSGVIGMFSDAMQITMTDVGLSGPDQGKGGLYLLLPPDHQGHVPKGYHTFKSPTYNVFLFFRAILQQGLNGPDASRGVANAEKTLIYPLSKAYGLDRPEMEFPNASFVPVDMRASTGFEYWQKLKQLIDYEPVEFLPLEVRGMLAAVGIIKGQPFNPDARAQKILARAADIAPKMILASTIKNGTVQKSRYYEDRQLGNVFSNLDSEWINGTYMDTEARARYFTYAYSISPAMLVGTIDKGAKYPNTITDADGNLLMGENTYKWHLPKGVPAKLYWSITAYNPYDGSMQKTSQTFPSTNSFNKLQYNKDGSIDIYFGPQKPQDVAEANWIETQPNKVFLAALRLYGTGITFFTKEWKPDDVVRVK